MAQNRWITLIRQVGNAISQSLGSTASNGQNGGSSNSGGAAPDQTHDYPGDFDGVVITRYAPKLDGDADPGEIVWTWVPYEEDYTQGKDRPVLIVGHDGPWLLGLMLTSKDHDRDTARQARLGRRWLDIGAGPWDRQGRESEIRLDRVIRVDATRVRREGAIIDRTTFDQVASAL